MLESIDELDKSSIEFSLLYKPKDIVSGDFYWTKNTKSYTYIVVADFTGHGVPGAFMSFLGMSYLNQLFENNQELSTNQVLDQLREKIIQTFKGSEKNINDGMDISIIRINKDSNILQFSGANNSLWVFKNSVLSIIPADKLFIGNNIKKQSF